MAQVDMKACLERYNYLATEKKRIQQETKDKLKTIDEEMKQCETPLIDFLVKEKKQGFAVEGGTAEIKLKSRTPKKSVSKAHISQRIKNVVHEWIDSNIITVPKDSTADELAVYCSAAIYLNMEDPSRDVKHWLEKKTNAAAKRKYDEMVGLGE
jgi:hypothetical protein